MTGPMKRLSTPYVIVLMLVARLVDAWGTRALQTVDMRWILVPLAVEVAAFGTYLFTMLECMIRLRRWLEE